MSDTFTPVETSSRLRSALEIATAILLGLVSVATAAGAYQASEWAQQSGRYASIAGQLRDESLASNVTAQLAGFDDGERLADALALEFLIMGGAEDVDGLRARQSVILDGASPGLSADWQEWIDSGYDDTVYPLSKDDFIAAQVAPTFGANRAAAVAYDLSDQIGGRSLLITVAAAVFALALLLLGVAGANQSLKVSFALAVGGAGAFVVGAVISLFAVIG
jgi:hypothetical protein